MLDNGWWLMIETKQRSFTRSEREGKGDQTDSRYFQAIDQRDVERESGTVQAA
jgi:hypothetical protein